jgi:hypothetical protein
MFKKLLFIALITVCAQVSITRASSIDPGFDLFHTPGDGGTFVDLSSVGLGVVTLEGAPGLLDPPGNLGNTDTIVSRTQGIDPFQPCPPGPNPCQDTIDIELVALSLTSIDPLDLTPLGGPFIGIFSDLFITIDKDDQFSNLPQPDTLLPSLGSMEVTHELPNGGTFESCFGAIGDCSNGLGVLGGGIFANAIFTVAGGDPNNPLDLFFTALAPQVVLEGRGEWSHTPDFNIESIEHTGPHAPVPAVVPVPAAVWLFGTALIGFVGMSRRRKVA